MAKFLWELDLDKISIGWEALYQDALINNPSGTMIEVPAITSSGTTIEKYFCHPVKCKEIMYDLFNKYKSEAKELYENQDKYGFKQVVNQLIKIDALLYHILSDWVASDEYHEESILEPKYYEELHKTFIISWYMDDDSYDSDFIEQYSKYKLINL